MTDEWFTPVDIVEAARQVMGSVDLDPASCDLANRTVNAARYYTREINGLTQWWNADTVWLNPPYSNPSPWVHRLVYEHCKGNVGQAILLVNNYNEARWWEHAMNNSALVCFPRRRLHFLLNGEMQPGNGMLGQSIFYFGPNPGRFAEVFSKHGIIMTQWKTTNNS